MSILAASIPPINKDLFDKLVASFPPVRPEPNITTMDEIMCGAGEQRVIEWLRAHALSEQIITGKADVSKTINVRGR